jgi:formylglycine-generating enzyme required for sulfatase activity
MNIQFWRLLEGQSFNAKYKLKKLLGFGAYGGVFLADEVIGNTFMRTVALKVILIDPDRRDSQIKELQISTTLNHAHILRCFTSEIGNPNGMDCLGLVMELGDESLDKRLEKGVLAPDLVREMVKGWASALQNTHSQSPAIIHRDLKPANILRVGNDWKISDFGVARLVGGKTASNTIHLAGSPVYMPPDAYNGEISPAFDMWSLGVMIVEMLTGKLPFDAMTVQELQVAVQSKEPQIKGKLPAPFDQIVKGCLIKDRKQRWTSQRIIESLNPQPVNIAPNIIIPKSPNISAPPPVAPQFLREIFAPANPNNLVLNLPNNQIIELVEIPAGSFMMGSSKYESEKPIHKVTLKGYKMGKYPITQAQYKAVMGNNPSHFQGEEKCPVEKVSWEDALSFCKKLSRMTGQVVKLPSEAQWEYACRSGNKGNYCFGDDVNQLGGYAWYGENSRKKTHAVGTRLTNAWGLQDMYGNVWEWCEDVWHDNYKGAPTDGNAWIEGGDRERRAVRGGSWVSYNLNCRSANRIRYILRDRDNYLGFRVVV